MKVKVNDNVLILSGKNKGKTGKVLRTFKKTGKIIVEKINIRVRHMKKKQNQPGERIQFEVPIPFSNVKIICPHCKKATRVGYNISKEAKKQRLCKKCREPLDELKIKESRKITQ
ncbi:50S ribosomal protein L24 [Candidatus Peregrinibacteria bacterium]|nr:50S ribosomal protein L24 [Candidatus Peregrinibacteria bacterium]